MRVGTPTLPPAPCITIYAACLPPLHARPVTHPKHPPPPLPGCASLPPVAPQAGAHSGGRHRCAAGSSLGRLSGRAAAGAHSGAHTVGASCSLTCSALRSATLCDAVMSCRAMPSRVASARRTASLSFSLSTPAVLSAASSSPTLFSFSLRPETGRGGAPVRRRLGSIQCLNRPGMRST